MTKAATQGFVNTRYKAAKEYDNRFEKGMKIKKMKNIPSPRTVVNEGFNEMTELNLAILSIDVLGYTKRYNTGTNHKLIARVMNLYLTEMVQAVIYHDGEIISIEGDGILAGFSNSETSISKQNAVRCALTMSTLLKFVVNNRIKKFNQEPLKCRYGIDYGRVYLKRVGVRGEKGTDFVYIGKSTSTAVKLQLKSSVEYLRVSQSVYEGLGQSFTDKNRGWTWEKGSAKDIGTTYMTYTGGWSSIKQPS